MLVLTRKERKSIEISNEIHVKVLKVSGGRVRLGIRAPRHVPVRRVEIAQHPAKPTSATRIHRR